MSQVVKKTAEQVREVVSGLRRHGNDSGSSEVQVAQLTARILSVTQHLERFSKDKSSRRGLVALVNQRRSLLDYLKRTDQDRYGAVLATLGLRR